MILVISNTTISLTYEDVVTSLMFEDMRNNLMEGLSKDSLNVRGFSKKRKKNIDLLNQDTSIMRSLL